MIPQKSFYIISALALAGAAFIAYANTLDGEWVWDDASSVLRHEHVQSPSKFFQLFREDQHPFGEGQGNFYRPLVAVSFMADYWLSYDPQFEDPATPYPDVPPFQFHLRNLGIHAVASILLFFLLVRLNAPRWVALVAALIFVIHPLHTEAVAYISGRADMMSAVFMFAGLWLALSSAAGAPRYVAWGFSAVAFVAALLSKESSLIFPVLLALVLFLPRHEAVSGEPVERSAKLRRAVPLLVSLIIVGIYLALRATVLNFAEEQASASAPLMQRVVETGQAFWFYIQKLLVPTGLHMEQTLAGTPAWTSGIGWGLILLTMVLLVLSFRLGQRRIAIGLAWFLASWLPISGLFPLNAPMAEHWMYVPMAGFWWAVCEAVWLGAQQRAVLRPALSATAMLLCLFFLHRTVAQNQVWHSNDRLFRATLSENPESMRVQFNLAVTYEDLLGNTAGATRYFEKILAHYQAQKEENPINGSTNYMLDPEVEVRLSLARLYLSQGRVSDAANHYNILASVLTEEKWQAVRAEAALGLGQSLLAMGNYGSASEVLAQATQIEPTLEAQMRALLFEGGAAGTYVLTGKDAHA